MTWLISLLHWLDGAALMVAIVGGIVGAIWALYQLGQKVNAAMRRQDRLNRLLSREFADDGNGSLKSQVNKTANRMDVMNEKLDLAKRELAFLQHTVDVHVADVEVHASDPEAHRRADWPDDGPAGPR